MTWKAYQVSFRLLSPMHVGWRKLGNLQQTRPYVAGRSIWGALTARLTRENGSNDYESTGKAVDEQLAFTYFYPSTQKEKDALWPWLGDEWDTFAWTFLGSYASTALEGGHNAEAGSLHETEFIAPHTRSILNPDGTYETKLVFLVGYIFAKDDCTLLWENALSKLQFGGERGYGLGRVQLVQSLPLSPLSPSDQCFNYQLDYLGNHPALTIPEGKPLLAHTVAENVQCDGTIEPLVGRETKNTGFGNEHSKAEICWLPGSKVKETQSFEIRAKGIWKLVGDKKPSA